MVSVVKAVGVEDYPQYCPRGRVFLFSKLMAGNPIRLVGGIPET